MERNKRPPNKESKNVKAESKETTVLAYLHDLVALVVGMFLIFSLCFRVVIVSGPSMENTLIDGDWLLLLSSNLYPDPKYGDVIVASKDSFDQGTPIIKRVIATEGQTVDINFSTGTVSVDGVILDEPYIKDLTYLYEGVNFPLTVDDGCLFVMGDNRNESKDSRSTQIGLIDKREILGKAFFLVFPGSEGGLQEQNFKRLGGIR